MTDARIDAMRVFSSFRGWAVEGTDDPREVIEEPLGHVVRNKVEAANARSDLFEWRRHLMEAWGGYLGEQRGEVVQLGR